LKKTTKLIFFEKKKPNVEQWNWKKRVKKGHWPTFTFQTRDGSLDQKHHTLKNQMLKDEIKKKYQLHKRILKIAIRRMRVKIKIKIN